MDASAIICPLVAIYAYAVYINITIKLLYMEDPHKAPEGWNLRSVNCHVCQVALVCTCPIDPPGLPRWRIDKGFVSWKIVDDAETRKSVVPKRAPKTSPSESSKTLINTITFTVNKSFEWGQQNQLQNYIPQTSSILQPCLSRPRTPFKAQEKKHNQQPELSGKLSTLITPHRKAPWDAPWNWLPWCYWLQGIPPSTLWHFAPSESFQQWAKYWEKLWEAIPRRWRTNAFKILSTL